MGTIQNVAQLEGHFNFDAGDYNILINKPRINGVELVGNKTSADLHIGGGGGGTSDYNDLTNKPKINGVGLIDDLTSHDLELQDEINFSGDASQYLNGEGNFTTPPSGAINYSTTEQDTGSKWIDGKNVYCVTIAMNSNVSGSGNIDLSAYNIGTMIDIRGLCDLGTASIAINEYLAPTNLSYLHYNKANNRIDYNLIGYTGKYTIIIEYTKA